MHIKSDHSNTIQTDDRQAIDAEPNIVIINTTNFENEKCAVEEENKILMLNKENKDSNHKERKCSDIIDRKDLGISVLRLSLSANSVYSKLESEEIRDVDKNEVGDEFEKNEVEDNTESKAKTRDLIAYWILGFCNNFTYWVMITAAYDLLAPYQNVSPDLLIPNSENNTEHLNLTQSSEVSAELLQPYSTRKGCNRHSTGAILLADTLPATILTLAAPLCLLLLVDLRVVLVCSTCVSSYIILGLAPTSYVFLGVALASASRGFSDMTFLGHSSHFHKDVLSVWSSGTGVATFVGPLIYSALTTAGIAADTTLLAFIVVPCVIACSFWCVLSSVPKKISKPSRNANKKEYQYDDIKQLTEDKQDHYNKSYDGSSMSESNMLVKKIIHYGRAIKFILPTSAFFFVMYFTNQGLLELVFFPASVLSHAQQYSWSNTVRCFGTMLSRSAHKFLLLPNRWLYTFAAIVILVFIACEIKFQFFPNEYFIFTLLFLQGLLEGATFRSTMFAMYSENEASDREFYLSIFPVSLFLPAVLAGLLAITTHRWLCDVFL